ncbi:MAG TPA: LacI family DNA-binding transcriptional regulator [Victivallales bacterium]|nr:LacI family DNA-binding transcriptional regulator [Victivallales bacterium]
MNITQKTIAKKLGVSVSLVSRALSGIAFKIGASPKTIKRIIKEAKKLNYKPNPAALSLRGYPSMSIGILVKNFDDPYLGLIIETIYKEAIKRAMTVSLAGIPKNKTELNLLLRQNHNAIIICGSNVCGSWTKKVVDSGVKSLQIGYDKDIPGLNRVFIDEEKALNLILKHLLQIGHTKFLFVGIKDFSHIRRYKILKSRILSLCNTSIKLAKIEFPNNYNQIPEQLKKSIKKNTPFTAIISGDDLAAIESLHFLRKKNIAIPDKISITGFDNIAFASKTSPPLTTVGINFKQMVKYALSFLTKSPYSEEGIKISFPPNLFIRKSTSAPLEKNTKKKEKKNESYYQRKQKRNRTPCC